MGRTGRSPKIITNDWIDSKKRVTGLIGFGGEGKSSLARRWIDDLLKDTTSPQPDGIFWWGFYDRPSVDEFFEAALNYLSGGNADLARRYPSSSARVHLLAGMLHGGTLSIHPRWSGGFAASGRRSIRPAKEQRSPRVLAVLCCT